MPLTLITVKNIPLAVKGDLSKWMQEIATGVYIGNFNSKIREKLWERVKENVGKGEATLSYYARNEIGYSFDTFNTDRFVKEIDGIPLIFIPPIEKYNNLEYSRGFSDAAKNRNCRKYASKITNKNSVKEGEFNNYVVIDIETDGLNKDENFIIEIGAIKYEYGKVTEFSQLISYDHILPNNIVKLTGITNTLLKKYGKPITEVLVKLKKFIGENVIIGYKVDFDLGFLNSNFNKFEIKGIKNRTIDLLELIKSKNNLDSYKLKDVLINYGINKKVPHRALEDAKLIYELFLKVI